MDNNTDEVYFGPEVENPGSAIYWNGLLPLHLFGVSRFPSVKWW